MRELLKSVVSFSWAMTLRGAKTFADLVPRGLIDSEPGAVAASSSSAVTAAAPGPFEPTTFVVLGEGLAAGMGHFGLESPSQRQSFPALMARALGTDFEQPLLQPPGLGDVPGMAPRSTVVPDLLQSTVLERLPKRADLGNLSLPGMTARGALEMRPQGPLVERSSQLQTLVNFVLGMPRLGHTSEPGPTQVEYAVARGPSLTLVCLGYEEAVRAAVEGNPGRLPSPRSFRETFACLLAPLPGTILVATAPDPMDSAYFSTVAEAAEILKTEPAFLRDHFGVRPDDRVALPGLVEMGYRMMNREVDHLPRRSPAGDLWRIDSATVAAIRAGVEGLNGAIRDAVRDKGARVYDLHGFFRRLAGDGFRLGDRHLSTRYLGGLFLLNGLYPGPTAHALVADDLMRWIGRTFGRAFGEVPVEAIAAEDGNNLCELAPGPPSTDAFLRPRTEADLPPLPPLSPGQQPTPIQTVYPPLQPSKAQCTPLVGVPAGGFDDPSFDDPNFQPLKLPESLEQTLDLNPDGSYFGDALRAVDCPNDRPIIPGFPAFGLCGSTFFGGPILTTSHLHGRVHVKFDPPDENHISRFELRHPGGLRGDDSELQGLQLFKMRAQHTRVLDLPDYISSGYLNLKNGRVTNFHYNVRNTNTAILTLFGVNPHLPTVGLFYPGPPNAGSTWARFDQRPDGQLDLTVAAHTFLPLGTEAGGEPIRFALPFGTPDLRTASFPARGTSIHPHIHFTTKASLEPAAEPARIPRIPSNRVEELTVFSHNTSFGDVFDLDAPEFGGAAATGRTQLMGRMRVQFGVPSGNTVPVLFSALPPGGLLNDAPVPPPFLPPGISRGLIGFDVVLHFPSLTYPQSGLASPDDPFNLTVGNVDLRTGRIVGPLLFRGYVVQALFADLIQVEPCTPADSFNYQGPASFERGADGGLVMRFDGTVFLPYPEGFKFPSPGPGGQPAITITGESRLDPFRRVQAMSASRERGARRVRGGAERIVSAIGESFSYRYDLPANGQGEASFEYTHHSGGGTFHLTTLSWLSFTHSREAVPKSGAAPDTLTFSGFGTWSEDASGALHQVSVQISQASHAPYVGIQVDGGALSNVDTKPERIADSLP